MSTEPYTRVGALEQGKDLVECEIDGKPWTQKPFPYQGKCLQRLRRDYESLAPGDRDSVDSTIAGSGLERLFA